MCYDVGRACSCWFLSRRVFDPALTRHDLQVIRHEAAAVLAEQRHTEALRISGLRNQLLAMLRKSIPSIQVNGTLTRRLPGNLNITIPGVDADYLIEHLPGLAISTGAAWEEERR